MKRSVNLVMLVMLSGLVVGKDTPKPVASTSPDNFLYICSKAMTFNMNANFFKILGSKALNSLVTSAILFSILSKRISVL